MKRSQHVLKLAAVASLGLTCSACSFLFTKKPPSDPDQRVATQPLKCTSSVAAPVIDSLIGGFQLVRTAIAINADDSVYENAQISREMDIGFGVSLAALYLSSAVYGFIITSDCRALRARFRGESARIEGSHTRANPMDTAAAETDPPDDAPTAPLDESAPLPAAY